MKNLKGAGTCTINAAGLYNGSLESGSFGDGAVEGVAVECKCEIKDQARVKRDTLNQALANMVKLGLDLYTSVLQSGRQVHLWIFRIKLVI